MLKNVSIIILFLSIIMFSAFAQKEVVPHAKENLKCSTKLTSATKNIEPIFSFGNFKSNNVSVEEFKKGLTFMASDGYVIISMTIYFAGAGFPNTIITMVSGNSTAAIKSQMDKLKQGSIVAFDNIKLKGKDRIKTFPGRKFTLY